jgi:hypothetical protein
MHENPKAQPEFLILGLPAATRFRIFLFLKCKQFKRFSYRPATIVREIENSKIGYSTKEIEFGKS